jgi:ABC-type uncharacterized transport system involved in gliding motility auxiliary subunit
MTTRTRQKIGYTTLLVLFLAFGAAVMASNAVLRGLRIDLTQNNLYTLAPGTRALLASIEEPINLYLFFSDEATQNFPSLRTYANRVRETLEEFAARSQGRLILQVIDPQPFSEEEDRAGQYGLEPVSLGAGGAESVYFGLAGSNSVGTTDSIPFFEPDPAKEAFLEYDLARLVYNLANPDKVVVGLLSGAPIAGSFNPQTQQPGQPWVVVQQARQLFEVRTLPARLLRIDDDVDILWVVHPTDLDETTLYALDQFVLRGGRALIFVDPFAEILTASGDPSGMAAGSSTLEQLFSAWRVEFSTADVVGDNRYALSIRSGFQPMRHIGLLGLDSEALADQDVITSGLSSINLGTPGHFTLADDATATLTPLLRSSTEAALFAADRFRFLPDPSELLRDFSPTGTQYVLAARLEGNLTSAFPDGPPAPDEEGGAIDDVLTAQHLTSTDNATVLLVGDVDILSDRLWVQVQNFLGQQLITAFANNGDFVINALDNLSGSAELIGLRSRATYSRPFTTVEALRRDADLRFRATEQQLQAELAETERKLGELQAARSDQSSLLMSPEQEQEVQRFLDQQLRIRGDLRAVRRDLDRSIDSLGTTLKVINVAAVPLALTLIAIVVVFLRRTKSTAR